jgi:uncharacterized membrane protein YjfL (UPF0719 family)
MWDFSDDEWVFMLVALVGAAAGALVWYHSLSRASRWGADRRAILLLVLTPPAALLALYVVLRTLSDPVYVAGKFDYTLMFLLGGAMWIFWSARIFSVLGISAREDALQRRNLAAALAVAGGMMGVMLTYAGSNVGNGPTIWTTLLPAVVATIALLLLWIALELIAPARDAITIDHDIATALRTAAFLVGCGAILGRAMAGDWHGYPDTFAEFARLAWPAIGLLTFAASVNRLCAPTPLRPVPAVLTAGAIPAAIMLAAAAAYIMYLGVPEIAPAGKYQP